MRTLKFGGTSLANAEKFIEVCNIIQNKSKNEQVSVVLSAPAKVTNFLEKIAHNIKLNNNSKYLLQYLENFFYALILDIKNHEKNLPYKKLINKINDEIQNIKNMIDENKSYHTKKLDNIYAQIISKGEIISIHIMQNILLSRKFFVSVIDPVKNILAIGNYLNATVQILTSQLRIKNINIPEKYIILMPGFIAGNQNQELVTLGRNGSDYSAAILAVCLNSSICEIWTDVDGIYTADPKIVPKAKLLKSISYKNALELSYLGAKVLHPKTIIPLSQENIRCVIKNTYFPNNIGTSIVKYDQYTNNFNDTSIQGITYLNNIYMIQIKIFLLHEKKYIINKILTKLFEKDIDILLNTFNNLQNTINFYILNKYSVNITKIIHNVVHKELCDHILKIVKIKENLKIISIIGNGIQKNTIIKEKVLSIVKQIHLHSLLIHGQLSTNAISIITKNKNIENIIQKIHSILFTNKKTIELFIIGCGGVGKTLIKQIKKQKTWFAQKNIKYKICSIANSKNMIINFNGLHLKNWEKSLQKTEKIFCINKMIKKIKDHLLYNPVIIDCTASTQIANLYCKILKNKINIVTPNKKANTNSFLYYQKIRKIAKKNNKKFLYETNVSAGLPIIQTLKNLFDSGDKLISFTGILSGSLSFIFGKLEEGISISESTKMAQKLGFTEPNPKDDLSGIDVARKLLILAREAGYKLELKDIKIIPMLPEELLQIENTKIFLSELSKLDKFFLKKIQQARHNQKVLRFIGRIKKNGICEVKLQTVDQLNPLYNIKNGENALIIYSKYYQPIPLVFRGYGAGNHVTAAGIFSDLLKILS